MTYTGNFAMAMSHTFFNNKLDFFKKNRQLYLSIENKIENQTPTDFTIKVEVSKKLSLPMNKSYTIRLDQKLEGLTVSLNYGKDDYKKINKLRFQVLSVLNKDNYKLEA